MKPETPPFLIFPSIRTGNGTGHLLRCRRLAEGLGEKAHLVVKEAGRAGFFSEDRIRSILQQGGREVPLVFSIPEGPAVSILDNRETEDSFYRHLAARGPVIALDEGGTARMSASLVIDTLPRIGKGLKGNWASTGLLDLSVRDTGSSGRGGVLVTFGGEDPAGLTEIMVCSLVPAFFQARDVKVLRPVLSSPPRLPEGVELLEPRSDLQSLLSSCGLVFCSFGLTAYEACAAGASVILLNPSSYHRALSRAAGFPEAGVGRPGLGKLKRLLSDPEVLVGRCRAIIPEQSQSLPALISGFDFASPRGCPACGTTVNPAVARFEGVTFFRCEACSLVYREDYSGYQGKYNRDYFFDEYKSHYGKTYIEDFDTIAAMALPRIGTIRGLLPAPSGKTRLLDVGCAFGPFLKEAARSGFDCRGIDVSDEAAGYVSKTLGIPARAVSFEEYEGEEEGFSVITMWYVIEHFADLSRVLEKVSRLLVPGGVFAFSTPNENGISGRRDLTAFLKASPADHRSVFSPSSTEKVLHRYGLSLERIRITGHHPERFSPNRGIRFPDRMYAAASRLFGMGDTFEAYAVKTGAR